MRYMCVGSRERAIVALPSSLGEDELREVMRIVASAFWRATIEVESLRVTRLPGSGGSGLLEHIA